MAFSVYMHQNPNNSKVYIGITCQIPERRWKNGKGYEKGSLFRNAIDKYGWDAFNHIILYDNLTKEEAESKEQELIRLFKSNQRKYGYNIQRGGSVNFLEEETKKKIAKANIGKKHSMETKRKLSLSHIGKQKCLGYKHSEETKEKHRKLWEGAKNINARAIDQYDMDGNFIRHYNYMDEVKKYLNIPSTCHISDCCRGKRNKCYGYKWEYSE